MSVPSAAHGLHVYVASLRVARNALRLSRGNEVPTAELVDQLHRAATSIVLNIAEGAAEIRNVEKRRLYRLAYRSANECAAILDVAEVMSGRASPAVDELRADLGQTLRMLLRLCRGPPARTRRR